MEDLSRKATLGALAYGLHDQKAALCMQCFAPGIAAGDCQRFIEYGFSLTTRHTYRFDPIPEPTALRGLAAKERRKGIASFRMNSFGDISHLTAAHQEPSFSARFCETWDCAEERHD